MTSGQLAVVGVRAQALGDALRDGRSTAADVSWAAQRLLSACERALGVRGRHYD